MQLHQQVIERELMGVGPLWLADSAGIISAICYRQRNIPTGRPGIDPQYALAQHGGQNHEMIDYPEQASRWLKSERQRANSPKQFKKGFIGARLYPHFDAPISLNGDQSSINKLQHRLSDSNQLRKWPFFPFLLRYQRVRRYRHNELPTAIHHRDQKKQTHLKSRPIMVAAHQDACLLAFYSFILTPYYEALLEQRGIQHNVVAYRSINGKNNVDFAKKAFEYMQAQEEMACILIDIKGFFDNIGHDKLRSALGNVLQVDQLPGDIEHMMENLTAYRFVDEDKLFKELKRLKKPYHVKIPGTFSAKRICKVEDFNQYIDNGSFIQKNITGKGIPQGSPVSGILANISLLEFDCWVRAQLAVHPIQFYQRYSDDIIIVCPIDEAKKLYANVIAQLERHGVSASTKKTEAFTKRYGKLENIVGDLVPGASTKRTNVQYLGLEWNGEQITLRPSTIARRLRPTDPRKLKPRLWQYHQSTFRKLGDAKPVKRQFYRIRKVINGRRETNQS